MAVVQWLKRVFISLTLIFLFRSPATFGCLQGEPNCNCTVSDFQVSSDPVGRGNPKPLESIVEFNASAKWAPGLSLGMKIYVDDVLVEEFPPLKNSSKECGMVMTRNFKVSNGRTERVNPSGFAIVDVVLFADHPKYNPEGGNLECDNNLCVKLQIHYHFTPSPENIEITMEPEDAREGDEATISCSTRDGFPSVKQTSLLFFNLDSGEEMFKVPVTTIKMDKAIRAKYGCQVTNYPLGEAQTVQSSKHVYVLGKSDSLPIEPEVERIFNETDVELTFNDSSLALENANVTDDAINVTDIIQEDMVGEVQARGNESLDAVTEERLETQNNSLTQDVHQLASSNPASRPNPSFFFFGPVALCTWVWVRV